MVALTVTFLLVPWESVLEQITISEQDSQTQTSYRFLAHTCYLVQKFPVAKSLEAENSASPVSSYVTLNQGYRLRPRWICHGPLLLQLAAFLDQRFQR